MKIGFTGLELPEGKIKETHTEQGDFLDLNAELSEEKQQELRKQLLPTPEAGIAVAESH